MRPDKSPIHSPVRGPPTSASRHRPNSSVATAEPMCPSITVDPAVEPGAALSCRQPTRQMSSGTLRHAVVAVDGVDVCGDIEG